MMPTEILNRSYFDAAQKGRDAAQGEQINALNLKRGQQQYDQNVLAQQYGQEDRKAEQVKQFAQQMVQASQYASQAPPGQTKQFIERNFPFLVETYGPGWQTASDDQIKGELQGIAAKYGVQAGIGPAPAPKQYTTKPGPRGSIIQVDPVTGEQKQVIAPDNSQPANVNVTFRAMTPQEIQASGLPAGTAAQINDQTRQIQVLSKPSVAPQESAAERKARVEAKVKMPRVAAALRRADRLGQAIETISKGTFVNGGPADAKVLQYTDDGREVMAASAQLMPELQALTRVPGIGSQSDLEARLASLAMPSLEMPPEVNRRSQAELVAFINDLKAAYETIANGTPAPTDVPDEAGPVVAPAGQPTLDDIRRKYGR